MYSTQLKTDLVCPGHVLLHTAAKQLIKNNLNQEQNNLLSNFTAELFRPYSEAVKAVGLKSLLSLPSSVVHFTPNVFSALGKIRCRLGCSALINIAIDAHRDFNC